MFNEPDIVKILKKEEKLGKLKINTNYDQTEQSYKNMIENSPFGILTVDTKGFVRSCNNTFVKMAGYTPDELVGKNIANFPTLRKRDIPKYIKLFKEIIKGDIPKPFEFIWEKKDKTKCYGELYVSLLRENNKIKGIQAIINDLTETNKTKVKLEDVEERYNSLFNGSRDLVYICDFKGNFIDANKSALNLLGYSYKELKNLSFTSLIEKKQMLKAFNIVREIRKNGYQKDIQEFKLKRKDGNFIYVETVGSLIYRNGKPYAIQGIARDITDRKISEIRNRKRTEDLELINLVNKAINSNQSLGQINELISKEAGKLFGSYGATIYLLSDDKKYLILKQNGLDNKDKKIIYKIANINLNNFIIPLLKDSIYSNTINNNKPYLIKTKKEILDMIKSATNNKALKKIAPLILKKLKIKSTMLVPLITEKKCIGLIDISSTNFFNENDLQRFVNIAQQVTIAIDKTILKESKEESEEKFYELYGRLRDGSATVDMNGKIINFNTSFKNMLGYSDEEIFKLTYYDITPEKWHKKEEDIIQEQVLKRGYSDLYEKEYIKKDGVIIPVEITTYLLKDKDGKPYAMWALIRDISERKKSDSLIKESEEKYKNLVNLANDGIAIIKDKKIEFLNQKLAEMVNYNIDELKDKEFIDFIAPEEKNKILQRYLKRIKGEKIPNVYESLLLKKTGDMLPVEINATIINFKGQIADMAIIRDISERKKMENKIEETKNHFQTMFNTIVDPVVIVDSKGKFLEVTNKVQELTGYKKEELIGHNFLRTKMVTEKSKRILIKNLIKRMSGIKIAPYEIEIRTKSGDIVPYEINAEKIKYKGKSADMVVFRNVSDRKRAEEAIRKSEEKFRDIFEKANDGIVYLDKSGKILDVNNRAVEIFGGTKKELLEKKFTDLKLFRAKDFPKILSNFSKIISEKEFNLEVNIKNKSGEELILDCSASYIKKDDNKFGLLAIVRDITDRKKAENELKKAHSRLNKLNEELEKKVEIRTSEVINLLKQKDEFINQLGHDLKNPLNPIINLIPLINEKIHDPNVKDQLNIVMKNVDFMKNLVVKTIELARLNSPETEFILEDTRLNEEIKNVIEKNQLFLGKKNIELINKLDNEIIVKADKLRLNELFDNLITNAIKYSPDGGAITLNAKDIGEFIKISIKDTGVGLNEDQLKHIFDEFYKVDKSRHDFDSSGLGLTICKRIVEKHGGQIWAESPGSGHGTTIFFTLPSLYINPE